MSFKQSANWTHTHKHRHTWTYTHRHGHTQPQNTDTQRYTHTHMDIHTQDERIVSPRQNHKSITFLKPSKGPEPFEAKVNITA